MLFHVKQLELKQEFIFLFFVSRETLFIIVNYSFNKCLFLEYNNNNLVCIQNRKKVSRETLTIIKND